jgi:hypothetical protein
MYLQNIIITWEQPELVQLSRMEALLTIIDILDDVCDTDVYMLNA